MDRVTQVHTMLDDLVPKVIQFDIIQNDIQWCKLHIDMYDEILMKLDQFYYFFHKERTEHLCEDFITEFFEEISKMKLHEYTIGVILKTYNNYIYDLSAFKDHSHTPRWETSVSLYNRLNMLEDYNDTKISVDDFTAENKHRILLFFASTYIYS